MLTLAMPQSEPVAERKQLGFAEVHGEDAGGEALGDVVVEPEGVVEVGVFEDVEDGAKVSRLTTSAWVETSTKAGRT